MIVLILIAMAIGNQDAERDGQGVINLVSLDSIDKHVRVVYTPPSQSVYATQAFDDTVYCMLNAITAWKQSAVVLPMFRDSTNSFRVDAVLPDSTTNLRIEICLRAEVLPEGIDWYTVGPASGHVWMDSVVSDTKLESLVASLNDDPLLHNYFLLNDYLYPTEAGDKYIVPPEHFAKTLRLASAFPRSALGRLWIERFDPKGSYDVETVKRMFDSWRTSWDVNTLFSIAAAKLVDGTPHYDPQDALWFLDRAEQTSYEDAAFYSGASVAASRGRQDLLASLKVTALDRLGRYDDAKHFGKSALLRVRDQYGREVITKALREAAARATDTSFVHELDNSQLPQVLDFDYSTIEGTKSSLSSHLGRVVVLDFWFAGCAGCAAEHKALNELVTEYKNDNNVLFLSISLNDESTLQWYLEKRPLACQVVPNGDALCKKLGIAVFPTHIVVDRTGTTQLWESGGTKKAVDNLFRVLNDLLK